MNYIVQWSAYYYAWIVFQESTFCYLVLKNQNPTDSDEAILASFSRLSIEESVRIVRPLPSQHELSWHGDDEDDAY